jgi:hypothetical protein
MMEMPATGPAREPIKTHGHETAVTPDQYVNYLYGVDESVIKADGALPNHPDHAAVHAQLALARAIAALTMVIARHTDRTADS